MKDRMDRRRAKEHFGILFIGLFCLGAYPTILNHAWITVDRLMKNKQNIPGQNYNF